jgi:hypothetical protein
MQSLILGAKKLALSEGQELWAAPATPVPCIMVDFQGATYACAQLHPFTHRLINPMVEAE